MTLYHTQVGKASAAVAVTPTLELTYPKRLHHLGRPKDISTDLLKTFRFISMQPPDSESQVSDYL